MDRAYVDEWWGQEPPTKEEFKVYGISFVPIERRRDETLYHFEGPDVGFERAMEDGYFMSVQYGEDEGHGGFEVYESLDEAKSKAPTDLEIELESLKADYDDFGPDGLYAVPFRTFERNYPEFTKSVIKTFLKEMGILTKEELNDPTTYIDYWQTGELITDQDWPCLFEGAVKLSNGEGVQWEKLYKKYYKPVDESLTEAEDKSAQQVAAELKQKAPNYEAFIDALSTDAKTAGFLEVIKNNYKKKFGELPEDDDLGVLKKTNCSSTKIPASELIPTQANISMEKSFGDSSGKPWGPLGTPGLALSIFNGKPNISGEVITYCGKYIIDGHHRWSKIFVINPECEVQCFDIAKIEGVNVADVLKGVQLAIALNRQNVKINEVQGVNLLDHPVDAVKKYVTEQLNKDNGEKILKSDFAPKGYDTVEKVAELLSGNVSKLPSAVANAPDRGFMPQTEYKEPGKDTYAVQTIDKYGIIDVTPDKAAPKKDESLNEGTEQSVADKLKKLVDAFALDDYKKRGNMYYFYGGGKITDRLSVKDVEEKSFNELFKLINDNDIDESLTEDLDEDDELELFEFLDNAFYEDFDNDTSLETKKELLELVKKEFPNISVKEITKIFNKWWTDQVKENESLTEDVEDDIDAFYDKFDPSGDHESGFVAYDYDELNNWTTWLDSRGLSYDVNEIDDPDDGFYGEAVAYLTINESLTD